MLSGESLEKDLEAGIVLGAIYLNDRIVESGGLTFVGVILHAPANRLQLAILFSCL